MRGVDDDLHDALKEEADRHRTNVNRVVVSVLREALGLGGDGKAPPRKFHDFDNLAGTWTKEEADQFSKELAIQRQIDEEMWRINNHRHFGVCGVSEREFPSS